MKYGDVEVVIDQSKENRRFRIRGVFVFFFSLAFAIAVVFGVAAVSANMVHKKNEEQKGGAETREDLHGDERLTLIGGVIQKEYISEEKIQKEEEARKKREEEDEKEEEIKIEEVKKMEEKKTTNESVSYTPPKGDKIVYLTFDDGPGPYTGKLLDVLKKYNVKVTFFVTCNRSQYRNMIKRAYDEGHSIGLHSCSHNYAKVYASVDAFMSEMGSVSDVVKAATGTETKLLRFPGGSSNTVSKKYKKGVVSEIAKKITDEGYVYFDWNVSSGDAGNATTSSAVYSNVTRSLKGNYSIVLQHDIKGYSVDAVEQIILFGMKYGFTFKALDMNSPTAHHRINN
jgi:peptidoglycan/xylan/chitin deacetylase (PgdA/CDA1 family)